MKKNTHDGYFYITMKDHITLFVISICFLINEERLGTFNVLLR